MNDFIYKKSLGQNFLKDQKIIDKIINEISDSEDNLIIEIGAGSGALTSKLSKLKSQVYSFEIDTRLYEVLKTYENDNTKIIMKDFLQFDLNLFLKDTKYSKLYFIGNLPYYITTPIIKKITEESKPYEIIIMIQKEVAQRYMAKPNCKEYGSITVYLNYNYNISKVIDAPKEKFIPKPKVDSMVIRLISKNETNLKNKDFFNQLVKDSFSQKRKNLRNNLKKYDLNKIENVLNNTNKDLSFRAEQITLEEYINISNEIS